MHPRLRASHSIRTLLLTGPLGAGGMLLCWWLVASPLSTEIASAQPAGKGPTKLYFGVEACIDCHSDGPKQNPILCRCNEYPIWAKSDKHRDAFKVLNTPRSRQIGELLKIDVKGPACVSCHGVHAADPALRHETFKEQDGVSCVACHGEFKEWVKEHGDRLERAQWRKLTRREKEERYGMRDLWDPVKRASLCTSCHIGDESQGRVLTHEMYAAGHPPLPGIEVASFSEQMPRHWEYLGEKSEEVRKLLEVRPEDARFERTQFVMLGGLVSYRTALDLLAHQAGGKTWPEFAQFDCQACHHDLKSPSWRQQRGYTGRPGRPSPPTWSVVLADAVCDLKTEDSERFDRNLLALRRGFDMRPFGNPEEIHDQAVASSSWISQVLEQRKSRPVTEAMALQFMRRLCELGSEHRDYDTARQLAWALDISFGEYVSPPPRTGPQIRKPEHAKMQAVLDQLRKELRLDLPAGQANSIIAALPANLEAMRNYDSQAFKQRMEAARVVLDQLPR